MKSFDETGEQREVQAAHGFALGHAPFLVAIAERQIEAIEKGADTEQRGGLFQCSDGCSGDIITKQRPYPLDINDGIAEFDADPLAVRRQSHSLLVVEYCPNLAQAPAQLGARVVGSVPEQIA